MERSNGASADEGAAEIVAPADVRDDGFEYRGTFYRWAVGDTGKDLMLIDRFAGVPVADFFEMVDDEAERGRAPILLTMIATSLRQGHPEWSPERIIRTVMDLRLSEVTILAGDTEESPLPPTSEAEVLTGGGSSSVPRLPPSEAPRETLGISSATQG